MKINRLSLIEGAKKAKGLVVIIDVFRAFSTECFIFDKEPQEVFVVEEVEQAYEMKEKNKRAILVGERGGLLLEGFEYGNSPHHIMNAENIHGGTIVHTTSAGTKGIASAVQADEIITGSFVNASAIANYIIKKKPETVSLVAMGNAGISIAKEDELCARYIESLVKGEKFDVDNLEEELFQEDGVRFHREETQDSQPKEDFHLCLKKDKFDFVIKAEKVSEGIFKMSKVR